MGFSCGLVGLPNVGKSTIFNALTAAGAAAENYPFCTIEPAVGQVPVPDSRLDVLAQLVQTQKKIPAMMQFTDIAGLIRGASQGEGLGNQFLAHIREVDAIAHVVRCFEDKDVIHVHESVDPLRDIDIVNTELVLADLETVEKALTKAQKKARSQDKDSLELCAAIESLKPHLEQGLPARSLEVDESHRVAIKTLNLLTIKPILYLANVAEQDLPDCDNIWVQDVRRRAQEEGAVVETVCGKIEMEIQELEFSERAEFLEDLGLKEPGLHSVIRTGYALLGLLTFFTAGPKEARAWTIKKDFKAPQAAGVIHTDFERGFIRAQTIGYDDFVACQGEKGAREKGRLRLEGKDYTVQEGDVLHFLFNT